MILSHPKLYHARVFVFLFCSISRLVMYTHTHAHTPGPETDGWMFIEHIDKGLRPVPLIRDSLRELQNGFLWDHVGSKLIVFV